MAYVITPDEIDFAAYERETDAQQKVKPASQYVQELIDRIRNPIKAPRALMPWHKTHNLIQFRPGEVTCWGGANGNGKSLVTGQVGLSLCAQDEKVGLASFEMKPIKSLERMGSSGLGRTRWTQLSPGARRRRLRWWTCTSSSATGQTTDCGCTTSRAP